VATALRRALTLLRAPTNQVAFAARSTIRWSRGAPQAANEPKDDLFDWLRHPRQRVLARARERSLRERYDLAALRDASTRLCYCENIALLDALERLCGEATPRAQGPALRAVDVGSGDFRYATALQRFLALGGGNEPQRVALLGLEVDGHGIYRDGHSRADHGRAHAALAGPGVGYEVSDFLQRTLGPQDVVSMLFPFLTRHALLAWGLPLRFHRPQELVARAASLLRPGGLVLSLHQTTCERDAMLELAAGQPLQQVRDVPLPSDLVPYRERTAERWGLLFERT
jgi:hypothetical protein